MWSRDIRPRILERDGYTCQLCGRRSTPTRAKDELDIDHVTPRALGGTDDPANLRTLCRSCNRGRALPRRAGAVIRDDSGWKPATGQGLGPLLRIYDEGGRRVVELLDEAGKLLSSRH